MKFDWIFLDVGSTIFDEEPVQEKRFEYLKDKMSECCGREVVYEDFRLGMKMAIEAGVATPGRHVIALFGGTSREPFPREYEQLYPGVREVLHTLRQSYKVGIIASQPAGLVKRLEKFDLLGEFDAIFSSAEVGLDKPDPRFYVHALETVGCAPERAVMVGDRVDNDMRPAKGLGMSTVRVLQGFFQYGIPRKKEEYPDITVNAIADLPSAIAELEQR